MQRYISVKRTSEENSLVDLDFKVDLSAWSYFCVLKFAIIQLDYPDLINLFVA